MSANTSSAKNLSVFRESFDGNLQDSLRSAVRAYYEACVQAGYKRTREISAASIERAKTLPTDRIKQIVVDLKLATGWLSQSWIAGGDRVLFEKRHLQKALDHYGLSIDPRMVESLDDETVVEIYTSDMIQIFRNLNLLDVTGYSIMDLSVFEWWVLWERSQFVAQQMHKLAESVLVNETPFVPFTLEGHVLKESFNAGMTEPFVPRNTFVHLQHLGFLRPNRPDAPRAFICTSKAKVLAEGFQETEKIAFL